MPETPPKEEKNERNSNGGETGKSSASQSSGSDNQVDNGSNRQGFSGIEELADFFQGRDFKAEHIEATRNRTEERRAETRGKAGSSGSATATNRSGSQGSEGRTQGRGKQEEKPRLVVEKPNPVSDFILLDEPVKKTATKPATKKPTKPEPSLASEDAIRDIVSQGIRAAFLGIGAFTKPPELVPAWDLSEDMVQRPTECFARTLKRLTPEQAELVQKYGDPILGCWELFSLYRIVLGRENELREYYAGLVQGTGEQTNGVNPTPTKGTPSDRRHGSGTNSAKTHPTSGIDFSQPGD